MLANQDPEIPVMFSMKRCGILLALFYTGLLPFVPVKESFLEIMLPATMLRYRSCFHFDLKKFIKRNFIKAWL